VTDYFGYDDWRSRNSFGSCELIAGAKVTAGTDFRSAYWSRRDSDGLGEPGSLTLEMHAGYLDGHVGKYSAADVVPMRVSLSSDGYTPYPVGLGPGVFYLPREGLE
jgi:hypothetical protein